MNYIVLDLEWNQCPGGKERENPRLPFEIIEIGAYRVSEQFQLLDSFSERIRPQVYHQLHYRTKQLLKVSIKEFNKCRKFSSVMKDFLKWCGNDYTFVTWGPMDLDYLQNNMDFYNMPAMLKKPLFYYDAQKLFSLCYEDGKSRKSLKYAADFLNLQQERPFHHAADDAYYTSLVLTTMQPSWVNIYCSVDYHRPPSSRTEEIQLHFPQYSKFVSQTYPSKEVILEDRMVTVTTCHECGRSLRKKIRWFTTNNSIYYALAFCPEHGYMQGKIRLKKADDGQFFAIRTTKMITQEQADTIRQRQEQLRIKRKIRRGRINGTTAYTPPAGTVSISISPAAANKRKENKAKKTDRS